jgi:hypothetical protein
LKDEPYNGATDLPKETYAPGETPPGQKGAYNCHSYAWYGAKGWKNNPTGKVKQATQLAPDTSNQIGDRVIYYVDKNHDGKWNKGEEIVHSAVVTAVDENGNTREVTGKMGHMGIGINHPDAPEYYETSGVKPTRRAYFRPNPQKPLPTPLPPLAPNPFSLRPRP